MKALKSAMIYLLVLTHSVGLLAEPEGRAPRVDPSVTVEMRQESNPTLIMNLPEMAPGAGATQFSYTEVQVQNPQQLADFLQKEETIKSDVLLSTDSVETYNAIAGAIQNSESRSDRMFRFIPVGKLQAGWNSYKKNVADSVKYDKLGLSIVMITTAFDSFIWIHSASLDIYQKSAMVIMNVLFTAAFALDRDMWTKMTVPLRHKIIKTLDKLAAPFSRLDAGDATSGVKRIIAAQFLANLTYSWGFQVLRGSIMSVHDLSLAMSGHEFWTKALVIAGITTIATFAWSELSAAADAEKNPVAKNALKRLSDVRNIVMSQLASMGMVLQPHIYGASPIAAIVTSGVLGLAALAKSNTIIAWLEKNKAAKIIFREQRKFEDVVNQGNVFYNRGFCQQLF
jgi:hypothetical protein